MRSCDLGAAGTGLSGGRVLFMLRRGWILMGGLRLSGRLLGSCLRGLGSFEGWGVNPLFFNISRCII